MHQRLTASCTFINLLASPGPSLQDIRAANGHVDLIEFIAIALALDADPVGLFRAFVKKRTEDPINAQKPNEIACCAAVQALSSLALAPEFRDPDGAIRATRLLGFRSTSRGFGAVLSQRECSMDRAIAEKAITIIMKEIHVRLGEAARIAKAAEACALAGSIAEGVTVSMDIEQIMYETGRLQDAASLLNRLSAE
jgi:hypothetical protein